MPTAVVIATMWLWLGLVPQLVLGNRHRRPWQLVGEWLSGPIGLLVVIGHRHAPTVGH